MYRKALVLAIFLSPIVCVAQSKFYIEGVVGTYSMKGMKELQTELNKDIISSGFPTKVVTDFPMSMQVTAGFEKIIGEYSIGAYLNYAFTKGRIHYGDYSGELYNDQKVSRILLGFRAATNLARRFEAYGKVGFNYTMLDLDFVTNIYGIPSERDVFEFYSTGLNIEPGISWTYPYKKLLLSLQAGYEINLQGKTIFKKDKNAHLLNDDGDKVIINWSGMRLGLCLAYKLGQ